MQTVSLNGVSLRDVSPRIIIHDVSETAPTMSYTAVDRASGFGQAVTGLKTQYRDITIKFAIADVRKDNPERGWILNRIASWMVKGGELRISDRDDQHIRVVPLTYPARPNSHKWNQDYTITFRTYSPAWVHDLMRHIGTASCSTVYDGSASAPLQVTGTVTATTVTIRLDNDYMTFSGLTVGDSFVLTHDESDRVVAMGGNASCLLKRTTASADALMLTMGLHTITVSGLSSVNICSEVRFL